MVGTLFASGRLLIDVILVVLITATDQEQDFLDRGLRIGRQCRLTKVGVEFNIFTKS